MLGTQCTLVSVIGADGGIVDWGYVGVVCTELECRVWVSSAFLVVRGPAYLWGAVVLLALKAPAYLWDAVADLQSA
jgi:hypothetical protein